MDCSLIVRALIWQAKRSGTVDLTRHQAACLLACAFFSLHAAHKPSKKGESASTCLCIMLIVAYRVPWPGEGKQRFKSVNFETLFVSLKNTSQARQFD